MTQKISCSSLNDSNVDDVLFQSDLTLGHVSCPDLGKVDPEENIQLKEEISRLLGRLASADDMIEELSLENGTLRKVIETQEFRIKQLTCICKSIPTTPISTRAITSTGNKRNRQQKSVLSKMNLDFSKARNTERVEISEFSDRNVEVGSNISGHIITTNKPSDEKKYDYLNKVNPEEFQRIDLFNTSSPVSEPDVAIGSKHRLIILGDEKISGLSAAMTSSREGKWNDTYKPFALIKPQATTSQILKHCDSLERTVSDGDIVILGLSSHDSNPQLIHSSLCVALNKLKNARVYILPVSDSHYLNERMLNNNLKMWTKHFENCTFIDINYKLTGYKTDYINYICKKINLMIDSAEYELQFLSPKVIASRLKNIIISRKFIRTDNKLKKGTIPYYFFKQTKGTMADNANINIGSCIPNNQS